MAATALHLVEDVLPRVPFRQWVLSVPKSLRFFLHRDPILAGSVLRIVLRAVERELRGHCPGAAPGARTGAVSFIQRFGASLNTHLHYHCCVIDGVFALDKAGGRPDATLRFYPAEPLDEAAVHRLQDRLRRRILKHFQRQGLLEADDVAMMLGWGHGGGFSLDASAHVEARDHDGLERLLRYCGRPPLAGERLAWAGADGEKVVYTLSRPDPDGRTVLILTPLELLQRLAHLVPPPRRHLLRYWGVLAPNGPLRARVTSRARARTGRARTPECPGRRCARNRH